MQNRLSLNSAYLHVDLAIAAGASEDELDETFYKLRRGWKPPIEVNRES